MQVHLCSWVIVTCLLLNFGISLHIWVGIIIQTMLRQFHGFDYILGRGFPGEGLAKPSVPKNWMDHICWRSVSCFIPYQFLSPNCLANFYALVIWHSYWKWHVSTCVTIFTNEIPIFDSILMFQRVDHIVSHNIPWYSYCTPINPHCSC